MNAITEQPDRESGFSDFGYTMFVPVHHRQTFTPIGSGYAISLRRRTSGRRRECFYESLWEYRRARIVQKTRKPQQAADTGESQESHEEQDWSATLRKTRAKWFDENPF